MKKKKLLSDRRQMPIIVGRFFKGFVEPVRPWFKELVSKYKESRLFPLFPTVIADFYEDGHDKEIAVLSTLCMDWNKNVNAQIQAMRELMGEHPYEWFTKRLFVNISLGTVQDDFICVGCARNWKIARFFSLLYKLYAVNESLKKAFSKKSSFESFAKNALEKIEYPKDWEYKTGVVELVLRASDGIGIGLWKNGRSTVKCPRKKKIKDFLKMWVSDYKSSWGFDEVIRWFGFEKDEDFFYFWLAWKHLSRIKPKSCSALATVFWSRYDGRYFFPAGKWKMYFPEIEF